MNEILEQQKKAYSETCTIYPEHLLDIERARQYIGIGNKILDVGCSDGQVSIMLKNGKNTVYGIDVALKAVSKAIERGIIAKVATADNIPFEDGRFDVIFCSHVIEHIFDTQKTLKEFNRVLKKDGKVIIITENLNSFKERILFLFGKTPTVMQDPNHVKFFNRKSITESLEQAGFKITNIEGSRFGFPIPRHCFFVREFDFLFPTWSKDKMIVVAKKNPRTGYSTNSQK